MEGKDKKQYDSERDFFKENEPKKLQESKVIHRQ